MVTVENPLFSPDRDVLRELAERTQNVEAQVVDAASRYLHSTLDNHWCLVAVGGFGRGDLFPYSDVDLLILVDRPDIAASGKEAIGCFLRTLWDAGLSPSHSVHTVDECCRLDATNVELTISLLTQRYLSGSQELYAQLGEKLPAFIRSRRRTVTDHLLRLSSERHLKYQGTIYHLEPDVKETPGGFRDLHLIEWLGILRGAPHQDSLELLSPARRFLFGIRTCLHERSKRNDNRLTFEAQDDLFANPAESMREYYRHARAIFREAQQAIAASDESGGMLRSFLDWRSRLSNSEFTVASDRVLLRTPQALSSDAGLALRLMQFVARHGFSLARDTERRLEEAVRSIGFQIPHLNLWREWRDLLLLPHAARAVRAMHETGMLKAILPEWNRIECLVTRDFYHRYTVDEHTLVTLENLEALAASKDDPRKPFRELMSETADLHLLRTALLLHDLGKGGGTGEHASESTRIATEILERFGAPAIERETILYLVAHHIDLSSLMTSRDLHDPDVVRAAAHEIGTLERLQLLTLVTFADISAVNPTALSPWRMAQLWSTYRTLQHELTSELDTERIALSSAVIPARAAFLNGFPTRYLMVTSPADVDKHFEMTQQAADRGVAVELVDQDESWTVTIVTKDRPGLLADLAGTLASFGMNILKAEAFDNNQDLVLDIFRFADPSRRLDLNPDEVSELKTLIERVALGQENVKKRLAARPKPATPSKRGRINPVVAFNGDASARATLLEVIAEDRPGLLYDLAHVISGEGCNIEVLLINTEAHKAIDVFYLTLNGAKLRPARQESLKAKLLSTLN